MADTPQLPVTIAGAPPQQWLNTPSPVYLTGEEFLRLSSLCNLAAVTLTVSGRVLRPDNTIERVVFTHGPNSNRTVATTDTALPEGWLLGITVRATSGVPAFGQVWVNLELGVGLSGQRAIVQTLGYGFCTANTPFAFATSVNALPLDGPGNLRSIIGAVPGAAAEIVETVPTGARWELVALRFQFTTSGVAGNRNPDITFDDGTNSYFVVESGSNFAASGVFQFCCSQGFGGQAQGAVNRIMLPLPSNNRLAAGHRIRTQTLGIQAADQYNGIFYLVREWLSAE